MPQVSVTIDNRKFRLDCDDGEEARIEWLAGMIDAKIADLRASLGEIGDQKRVVAAALIVADNLAQARDEAVAERKRVEAALSRVAAAASGLEELGARLEAVAARLAGSG